MLKLITGKPGDGKTLYAVDWLATKVEENAEAVAKGKADKRHFFSDIKGLKIDGVENLLWAEDGLAPLQHDWRECPEGSVIVYDEAHNQFPSTGKPGRSEDLRIRAMDQHRHRGIDIVFITQWPTKIHHEIRTMVGEHVHVNRAMGLERAALRRWARAQIDPYDEKVQATAEEEIWKFPKKRYAQYVSSSMHTDSYKFRVPKAVWGALSMLVVGLFVCWGLYSYLVPDSKAADAPQAQAQGQGSGATPAPAPQFTVSDGPPPTGEYATNASPKVIALAGCVYSDHRPCRCFSKEGDQLDMTQKACRVLVSKPIVYNIYAVGGRSGSTRDRDKGAGQRPAVMGAPAPAPSSLLDGPADMVQARYGQFRTEPIPADPAFGG